MGEGWEREWRGDLLVALLAILICVAMGLTGQPDWWWSVMMVATLALRRTCPAAMAVLAACVSLSHLFIDGSFLLPGDAVLLAAAYTVAAHGRGRGLLLGALTGLAYFTAFTAITVAGGKAPAEGSAVLIAGLLCVSLVAASSLGLLQRRRADALREAEQRRDLSERDAEARAQLAAHEERERINDEMHDILAHTLTGIVIQAESGKAIAPAGEVCDLLTRISEASRSALLEVRGLLTPTDTLPTQPSPGVDDLEDLLEGFRESGLKIYHQERGERSELSPGLSLALYRVIQESLTNAMQHGAGNRAAVITNWTTERLTVKVSNPVDDEVVGEPVREHRGIAGMRRRCTLFGGSLHYEAQGAFTIIATWPLVPAGTSGTS